MFVIAWLHALPLFLGTAAGLRIKLGGASFVSIDNEGIDFTPEEQCASDCYLKAYQKTSCDFRSSESLKCACATGHFTSNIDDCLRTDCPNFRDELASTLDEVCPTATSTSGSATPTTTGYVLTPEQACQFNCGLKAFNATNCPLISKDSVCPCTSDKYFPKLTDCITSLCPTVEDSIMSDIQDECHLTHSTSGHDDDAMTSNSSNNVPSGTAIAQTSTPSTNPSGGVETLIPSGSASLLIVCFAIVLSALT
ncbi:hypothetical protein BKA62DRAFT_257363 [Auriculariales sp. MPI-PUGE-AT-0066]|nr:hypothetical protein BKA62DRAFT_257363 [Auriculariales sp. MPI-PUGE-AT-0066]